MKKRQMYLFIAAVAVIVIGLAVVFTDSLRSIKANQSGAEITSAYCADPSLAFCDEFDSAGIDIAKWKDIQAVEGNNWIQEANGILRGSPRAVSIPEYGDFTYETKLKLGYRADLVFRYRDLNNYYAFKLRSAGTDGAYYGRIIPAIVSGGVETDFEAIWDKQAPIVSGQNYVLKIVGENNKFNFYLDGKMLGTWTDAGSAFSSGNIGFKATSEQGTEYDYVRLSVAGAPSPNDGDKGFGARIMELLTGGAGKSGKVPGGLENAPGIQQK